MIIKTFIKGKQSELDIINKTQFYTFCESYTNQIIFIYDMGINGKIDIRRRMHEIDPENLFVGEENPLMERKRELDQTLVNYKIV